MHGAICKVFHPCLKEKSRDLLSYAQVHIYKCAIFLGARKTDAVQAEKINYVSNGIKVTSVLSWLAFSPGG